MSKLFTAYEVKQHNNRKSIWIVIRNDVYDVTSFLNEHPGGEDPLLDAGGQDATIAFDDVGHSADAREMLAKYKIGSLAPGQGCQKSSSKSMSKAPASCPRIERRVQKIVVPRERLPRGPPRTSSSASKEDELPPTTTTTPTGGPPPPPPPPAPNESKSGRISRPPPVVPPPEVRPPVAPPPEVEPEVPLSEVQPTEVPPPEVQPTEVPLPEAPPPRSSDSSWWKWALLALGIAVVAGIVYKRQSG